MDPGLDQRSTPPPPESLPSLLLQREPADRPRPRPQARPPVSPRLHATPTDPTCAGTVRASCVLATTSGQAKHRARAPQGHIQQGRGLVSHPQAWHGAGATRPAERTCERESGMPTPSREPVHGNQGCLHPAGFSEQGLCLLLCLRPPPAWPQGWRRGRVQAGTGSGRSGVREVGPRLSGLRLVLRRRGDEGVQHPGQQEHRVDVTRGGSHRSPGRAGGRAGSRSGGGFLPQHRVRAGLPGRAAACPASFMMPREQ